MNDDIKKILLDLEQEKLWKNILALSDFGKKEAFAQINLFDLDKLKEQRSSFFEKNEAPKRPFVPLDTCSYYSTDYASIGERSLREGEVGVIILAGGMGTRLQWNHPKGTFLVSSIKRKSLFQIFSEKIVAAQKKYKRKFKIAFMTSNNNHAESLSFFEKHGFFGLEKDQVFFFKQDDLPFLNEDGGWEFSDKILAGPDGNGDLFKYFKRAKLAEEFKKAKIKHVMVLSIDNPLADPVDEVLVGFHKKKGSQVSLIAIEKEPLSMGAFVLDNAKIRIKEYIDLTEEERERCLFLNTGIYCFDLSFFDKEDYNIPFHHVLKEVKTNFKSKLSTKKIFKSEKFLFDLLSYSEQTNVICYPKFICYAPLKNYHGNDSLKDVQEAITEKDRFVFKNNFNIDLPKDIKEISFDFHYPTEELIKKSKNLSIKRTAYLEP